MNAPTKVSSLQAYQLVLYKRALHPELFQMKARRTIRHGAYDYEAWLMPGTHLLRFQYKTLCAVELVTDREDGLPTNGAVATFPCAGEKDYEHGFSDTKVNYMTTVQTETLSENLFASTYQEMLTFAAETDAVRHEWTSGAGKCLSLLDIQRYPKEIHTQSYHLIAEGGLVLRTQTIFEHE